MKVYAYFIPFESVFDGAISLECNVRLDFLVFFSCQCISVFQIVDAQHVEQVHRTQSSRSRYATETIEIEKENE